MKNKVRHNTVDARSVSIEREYNVQFIDNDSCYVDLYYDYERQQKNIYIKPKRALKAWHKAIEHPRNGKPRTLVRPDSRIIAKLKQQGLYRELGL